MKYLFTIMSLFLFAQSQNAQDSWTVKLNNKVLLTSSNQDAAANSVKIKNLEWRKNCFLEVLYQEPAPSTWLHSFYFADKSEEKSLTKDSTTKCKISVSTLRKVFEGKKEINIYMIISPPNPMMAVPTRRIHLCTLLLP